jgi:hypothetical protein
MGSVVSKAPCCKQMRNWIDSEVFEFYPGWHDSLPREFREALRITYGPANLNQPRVLVMHSVIGEVPINYCPSCAAPLIGHIEEWDR